MSLKNSLLYILPALFILLMVLPIFVEVRVSFNPLYNRGVVAIFVLKKKLLSYIVSIHGKYIILRNETETKVQKIQFAGEDFEVIEKFGSEVVDKVKLKKLYVFYNIGTGDAFSSALLCGEINQICIHLFHFIKSHKPTASLCFFDTVSYNKEMSEVAVRTEMSISLFDIAYSLAFAFVSCKC